MKKFWKSLMCAALGVFALSSCEDVPAPYAIPGTEGTPTTANLASVDFTQGKGNWEFVEDPSFAGVWKNNSQYGMVASGFKSSKANAATSWLVSPEIDLTQAKEAKAIVNEAINKIDGGSVEEMMTVWATTDDGANWSPLTANARPSGTSWNFQDDEFDLSSYDGQKIKIGFKYISTEEYAGTWEIKSVTIKGEGSATIDGQSTQPGTQKGEPKGSGTAEDPYNVAALDSFTTAGSYTNKAPSEEVYVKGIVSEIGDLNTQYGELNYYISDDGSEANQFYVYNGYGLNGEKITSADYLKKGDVVIIVGKVVTYNGTNEFTYGSKIVSLNGNSEGGETPTPNPGEPKGDGTAANPYNPAGVNAFIAAGDYQDKEIYFTGTICDAPSYNEQYGSATFHISEDGQTSSEQFYLYRALGFNGEKIPSATSLKKGDVVVFRSTVTIYTPSSGTPVYETVQNKAILVSVNGKTEFDETPDPTPDPSQSEGISVDGTTITLTNSAVTAGTTSTSIDLSTLGYTNAQDLDGESVTMSDGTIITFSKASGSTTPKYYDGTKGVRMYANNSISFNSTSKAIAKVVLVCDAYSGTDYVGNDTKTASFEEKTVTLYNTFATNSGGVQLRVKTITVTYAE